MGPFGGWEMPIHYAGIIEEHLHTRAACSLFDICHMGEFELEGVTAEADLDRLLTQRISTLKIGQCRYGYLLNERGCVLDDLTCYRLGEHRYYLVVNAATAVRDKEWIVAHLSSGTTFTDRSAETAKLDVQGPCSQRVLEECSGTELPSLKYFRAEAISLFDADVLLSRTGYTGEWGYELYVPTGDAVRIWTLLLEHQELKPAGLGARDTLRLEMGYPLYGHELFEDRSPLGAGHGLFVDFTKSFIGRDVLMCEKTKGSAKVLVGLCLSGRQAARAGDKVLFAGCPVGFITSGSYSPSLKQAIALAYVDTEVSEPKQELDIAGQRKTLPAVIVPLPFYNGGTARGR